MLSLAIQITLMIRLQKALQLGARKKKKLHFFKAEEIRKKQRTEENITSKRARTLYVMKEGFFGNVRLPALQK